MSEFDSALSELFSGSPPKVEESLKLQGKTVLAVNLSLSQNFETNVFIWDQKDKKLLAAKNPYPKDGNSLEPYASAFSTLPGGQVVVHFFWGGQATLDLQTGHMTAIRDRRPW